MTVKKKIKPDAALKDFWRDRERFADLFNGTLFGGEKVLMMLPVIADGSICQIILLQE